MKQIIIPLIIVVALGAYVYFSGIMKPLDTKNPTISSTPTSTAEPTSLPVVIKELDVKGLDYSYDIKEIRVKLNDTVKINFINTEGFHDLVIDELKVATKKIKAGESEIVEFKADKVGTFEYYCSVGQHRANGMWGKLIVE